MCDLLTNELPIDFRDKQYRELLRKLQGNILKGHGRDYTINIFLQFTVRGQALRNLLQWLGQEYVTSAYEQLVERDRYKRFGVPGGLFGNLFLSRRGYEQLQLEPAMLENWFRESDALPEVSRTLFLDGMYGSRNEFHDVLSESDDVRRQPLEVAYQEQTIDAMMLLADDTRPYLLRRAAALMSHLQCENLATVVAVEHGEVLRNANSDGVEHFGYVDGRSQPLFLTSDFHTPDGPRFSDGRRRERIAGLPDDAESGRTEFWDPFAQLKLALVRDPAVDDSTSFGSFYVFRKLEQDVRRFAIAEQQLADALGLKGADRARAGAMIVGRFRDGTPLTLSSTSGLFPPKANDFRYDGLNATLAPTEGAPTDAYGLKCPFQAHIRKVNPRQNVNRKGRRSTAKDNATDDRERRIVRRGIPYGTREPRVVQSLEDLPNCGVGLLFGCFQASLCKQFGFMQRMWANNICFLVDGDARDQTGLDGLIGQRKLKIFPQHWRSTYGGSPQEEKDAEDSTLDIRFTQYRRTHTTDLRLNGFVTFRGGEFFFAPSLTFLLGNSLTERSRRSGR